MRSSCAAQPSTDATRCNLASKGSSTPAHPASPGWGLGFGLGLDLGLGLGLGIGLGLGLGLGPGLGLRLGLGLGSPICCMGTATRPGGDADADADGSARRGTTRPRAHLRYIRLQAGRPTVAAWQTYGCSLAGLRLRAVAAWQTYGCSLGDLRLQPGRPTVAAWETYGCSLGDLRLQPGSQGGALVGVGVRCAEDPRHGEPAAVGNGRRGSPVGSPVGSPGRRDDGSSGAAARVGVQLLGQGLQRRRERAQRHAHPTLAGGAGADGAAGVANAASAGGVGGGRGAQRRELELGRASTWSGLGLGLGLGLG